MGMPKVCPRYAQGPITYRESWPWINLSLDRNTRQIGMPKVCPRYAQGLIVHPGVEAQEQPSAEAEQEQPRSSPGADLSSCVFCVVCFCGLRSSFCMVLLCGVGTVDAMVFCVALFCGLVTKTRIDFGKLIWHAPSYGNRLWGGHKADPRLRRPWI